jgi:hypothetical protein
MGSDQEDHFMFSFVKKGMAGRIAALAALAVFSAAGAATAASADELLEANINAIGGEEAIAAVKTIHRKGDVFVDGQFGVMEGTYERVSIIGQKAYNMRDLGVFVQAMGFDGEKGWKDDAMTGIVDIEGGELEQIRAELVISPLVGIKAEGAADRLSAAGTEEVDGVAYNVLELAREEGQSPVRFYLDPETNLLARTQLDQDSPQWGPITIVLTFSGYQEHGGVMLPGVETIDLGDFIRLETTYNETVINGEVDESIFDKPQPPAPPAAPAAAAAPTTETEAAPEAAE